MLATFVIGLREGLEAALIVGIIAAFLRQSGRADALRTMWVGVAVAVLLCLGVGLLLQHINSSLPQRQQEMLECVVAAIAVVMVSYMVLWLRAHSRSLKSDLQDAAAGALASGSANALVVMAFLAVFREGFETAVFLLAAFESAVSPAQAVTGAVLGIVIAVGLGYLIYRGGMRLNLSRFFRLTGVVLVLVAAGLVMSALRAAYEAGWLIVGQQHAISLSLIARPGTVQESLLTGVLGVRTSMPVIEMVAYLLYLVPMLAVVLWPAQHALSGRSLGRVLAGVAAVPLLTAAGLYALAPSAPTASSAAAIGVSSSLSGVDPATGAFLPTSTTGGIVGVDLDADMQTLTLSGSFSGSSSLQLSGHPTVEGISAAQYAGTPVSASVDAAGLPATLTLQQVAALGGGRMPIGLSISGNPDSRVTATYSGVWTPTVTVDPATGLVLDLQISTVASVKLRNTTGAVFPGGQVSTTETAATAAAVSSQTATVGHLIRMRENHQVIGEVIPGLLIVFAVVLLAFAGRHLLRRRGETPEVRVAKSPGVGSVRGDAVNGSAPGAHQQLAPTEAGNNLRTG